MDRLSEPGTGSISDSWAEMVKSVPTSPRVHSGSGHQSTFGARVISGRIIHVPSIGVSFRSRGGRRARDGILAVDPSPEIDQTAALGAEWKGRQLADRGDLEAARTSWTASPNHDSVFGPDAAGFADSVLDGVLEGGDATESPDVFVAPFEDDLSASAAFL
jgi:hypothetical protein